MYNEFRRTDMKNLKKMFTLCSLAFVFTVLFANASFAEDSVMQTGMDKALRLFVHIKTIIFVVGAFGLIGIAFQAIFGKVKWTWFAGLAVGLAILAAAGAIVNYATGGNITSGQTGDTFVNSGTGV